MKVVCLLPARNAAADLPAYFESVASFADGIVALDDGSTDATGEMLRSNPLVLEVLTNPRRETYAGWDDLGNRMRLMRAAEPFAPDWILWLDADEIVEASDAAVLRQFLKEEAEPHVAYALEVLRMVDGMETYDKCAMWRYRLYSFEPGYTFENSRLHLKLVPLEFPTQARRRTSFRILHRSSLTEERRVSRYAKYGECDPDRTWQSSYESLLDPPRNVKRLKSRCAAAPFLLPADEESIDA